MSKSKTLKGTPLFTAKAKDKELQMEIYDAIGQDFFGEGITPQIVTDALKNNAHDSVTLRINSPGGVAHDGIAIYNVLKSHGKPVNVIVDGVAASAASIVAMAGDTITMNTGTTMMIHPAMMMAAGNAAELRKEADVLDKVTASMADIYVARTGQDKQQVMDWLNAETWMSPEEAVERGFATATSDQQAVASLVFDLSAFKYKNVQARQGLTKKIDGENLTADDFIYVGNSDDINTWHLPWRFSTEEKTQSHLRDALSRFDQTAIPPTKKAAAKEKLLSLCKEHGIEVSESDGSAKASIGEHPVVETLRQRLAILKSRK